MELKPYLSLLWRWSWLIGLCAVLAGGAAFLVSRLMTPVYQASTTLIINPAGADRTMSLSESLMASDLLVGNYVQLMQKRPVLEAVIANLALNTDIERLARTITARPIGGTQLIVISAQDPDPQHAANIANESARVLISHDQELMGGRSARSRLAVVEPALPELRPAYPRTPLNMMIAVVLGVLVATGIALLVEHLNDRVKNEDDITAATGLPTLAAVGRIKGATAAERLVVAQQSFTPAAEAYRMLRTQLAFKAVDQPLGAIAVASSAPLEGKSTVAANLALALALAGQRVILVDTDLRRPTLHSFFQQSNQRGVTTVLLQRGGDTTKDHLVPTGIDNLRLMPAGPLPPNPAELLGSQRMRDLLAELRQQADVVVFDSSPLLLVADALLIARQCDATLLVARAGMTRPQTLKRAYERMQQAGIAVAGVVLNEAAEARDIPGAQSYYTSKGRSRSAQPLAPSDALASARKDAHTAAVVLDMAEISGTANRHYSSGQ